MPFGVIETIPELWVEVEVAGEAGTASGRGNVLLSDIWAWPGDPQGREDRVSAMRAFSESILGNAATICGGTKHPLEHGWKLYEAAHTSDLPALAACLCISPLDAAIHDAAGRLQECSAFDLATQDVCIPEIAEWFPDGRPVGALRELLTPPLSELPAWWLLTASDHSGESASKAFNQHGIERFKVKLGSRDPAKDAKVFARVYSELTEIVPSPVFSVDMNESCTEPADLYQFVENLNSLSRAALESIQYIEQPIPRNDWMQVVWDSKKLGIPLVLDEGLTSLNSVLLARRCNWEGIALKTCKGHTFALLAAALAKREGMKLYMQDLTNVKEAAVHSFVFGSRVQTLNGIELNSPFYVPNANGAWAETFPDLFFPTNGKHRLDQTKIVGLGAMGKYGTEANTQKLTRSPSSRWSN
jgi:L-alanine-DL-glutamate epimerase-like enolase superfamily enzyme